MPLFLSARVRGCIRGRSTHDTDGDVGGSTHDSLPSQPEKFSHAISDHELMEGDAGAHTLPLSPFELQITDIPTVRLHSYQRDSCECM